MNPGRLDTETTSSGFYLLRVATDTTEGEKSFHLVSKVLAGGEIKHETHREVGQRQFITHYLDHS